VDIHQGQMSHTASWTSEAKAEVSR
jgi:hypothetical protein